MQITNADHLRKRVYNDGYGHAMNKQIDIGLRQEAPVLTMWHQEQHPQGLAIFNPEIKQGDKNPEVGFYNGYQASLLVGFKPIVTDAVDTNKIIDLISQLYKPVELPDNIKPERFQKTVMDNLDKQLTVLSVVDKTAFLQLAKGMKLDLPVVTAHQEEVKALPAHLFVSRWFQAGEQPNLEATVGVLHKWSQQRENRQKELPARLKEFAFKEFKDETFLGSAITRIQQGESIAVTSNSEKFPNVKIGLNDAKTTLVVKDEYGKMLSLNQFRTPEAAERYARNKAEFEKKNSRSTVNQQGRPSNNNEQRNSQQNNGQGNGKGKGKGKGPQTRKPAGTGKNAKMKQ